MTVGSDGYFVTHIRAGRYTVSGKATEVEYDPRTGSFVSLPCDGTPFRANPGTAARTDVYCYRLTRR